MSQSVDSVVEDFFWTDMMHQLEAGKVVPVVGQDLLEVEEEGVMTPLNTVVARRALRLLGLGAECSDVRTLNDAAVCYLTKRGTHLQRLYKAVHYVVSDPGFPIPELLRTLARVDAFKLYVTTGPDPLLRRAIDDARATGNTTLSYAYSIAEHSDDLPAPLDEMPATAVYHLLGETAATESYALTEEDTLEFLHSLQSNARRPERLFEELQKRSLLIIGSGYSDWLTRFFLRVTRGVRLRQDGPSGFLAETAAAGDDSLVRFLRHFSASTQVIPGDPREFVEELADRWAKHAAEKARRTSGTGGGAALVGPEPQVVFISYAREDLEKVERLADSLIARGLPVWFDKNELRGGDAFDREIHAAIGRCSLFIPVLSRQALTNQGRYFFSEWKAAIIFSDRFGAGRRFILPCRIDDVPRDAPRIPEANRALHVEDVVDDASREAFADLVRKLFREYQLERTPV